MLIATVDRVRSLGWVISLALISLPAGEVGAQVTPMANYIVEKSFQLPGKGQPGAPDGPTAVAPGPDGTVHVADSRGQILVYDASGTYRRSYGKGQLRRPVSVAVHRNGEAYVLDAGRSQVLVFAPGGQMLRTIGAKGIAGGFLSTPNDLALGPSGHVYILDPGRRGIQVFSLDGVFIRDIRPGDVLKQPVSIAVGNDGSIYVVDKRSPNLILILAPYIKLPWTATLPRGSVAGLQLRGSIADPVSVAVNDNGTVLILDKGGGGLWGRNRWQEAESRKKDLLYGGIGSGRGSFREAVDIALNGSAEVLILDRRLRKVERVRLTTEEGLARRPDLGYPVRVSKGTTPLSGVLHAIGYGPDGSARFVMSRRKGGLAVIGGMPQIHATVYGDSVPIFRPNPEAVVNLSRKLGEVSAAAMNHALVVVTEQGQNRFVLFGLDGKPKGAFGDNYRDARRLKNPNGVAILPDGRIFICDTGNNRVKMYSADLANLVGNYTFPNVYGVAVSPSGEVLAWSEDGKQVGRLIGGTRFSPVAQGLLPEAVIALAFDEADNLFALDRKTRRVTIIESGFGRILAKLGIEGGLKNPNNLLVDSEGNIYISDPGADRTVVYRWDVAFPPPADLKVAYERGAIAMSWAPGPERYVEGYQIRGARAADGPYHTITTSDSPSFRLDTAALGGSEISYVRGSTIYISGAAGSETQPYPLFNITAAAAYENGDYRVAIDQAREALILIRDGVLGAGNPARGELLWLGFAGAYALGDYTSAVKWGEQVGGWAPPERRIELPFKMAEAYLKLGNPKAAGEQLLASIGGNPRPDFFRDPAVIRTTFRVYEALESAGYKADAGNFLRFYAGALPSTVSDVKRAYEDSLTVRGVREKLEPGFQYWRSANYQDAMRFFEDVLLTGDLSVEQQVVARQILAAGYYAFGRRTEAEDVFREIYRLRPNFDLRTEIVRINQFYGLTIYNPETQSFFGALKAGL